MERGGYDLFWATHDGPKWGQFLGHYDTLSAAMAAGSFGTLFSSLLSNGTERLDEYKKVTTSTGWAL